MTEQTSYPETHALLQRVVEMEKELMRMKRAEKVLREREQRCLALMDSAVFLCAVFAPDGRFRAMNRRAEEFFGFQMKTGTDVTLQSLSGPGHAGEVTSALKNAAEKPVHAALPVVCPDGAIRWLEAEYSPTLYQGNAAVQIIASDISGLVVSGGSPASPKTPGSSQMEFLDSMPGMFFVADDDARCVNASAAFLNMLKLERDAAAGRYFREFLLEGDPINEEMAADFVKAVRAESFDNLECKAASKDGDVLYLGLRGTRIQIDGKTLTLVSCADNTKLRRTEEQLKRTSTTDASTGILNRQGMERVLSAEIERAARYKGSLSMIILDIDGFRRLNEQLGYSACDKVLKELTAAVKPRIQLTDFLGRWGGDEFMLLTPAPIAAAVRLAEDLRGMAQHMPFAENHQTPLTISAGVAEFRNTMDISSFVGAAYDAMAEAKRKGGNRTAQAQESAGRPDEAFLPVTDH